MIFGQWKPFNICAAAMFFAVFKSLANIADSTFLAQLHWSSNIYNMMPFIASMIILAFTSKTAWPPRLRASLTTRFPLSEVCSKGAAAFPGSCALGVQNPTKETECGLPLSKSLL